MAKRDYGDSLRFCSIQITLPSSSREVKICRNESGLSNERAPFLGFGRCDSTQPRGSMTSDFDGDEGNLEGTPDYFSGIFHFWETWNSPVDTAI